MHDINLLRADKGGDVERFYEIQRRRYADKAVVDQVVEADKAWRAQIAKIDDLRYDHRNASKVIGQKKKAKEECDDLMAANKELAARIADEEKKLDEMAAQRDEFLKGIGNFVHDSVPVDNNEDNNKIERTFNAEFGEELPKKKYNHVDLVHMCDLVDTEKGSIVAGNRGYFLKNEGVLLNMALLNYGMSFLAARGYNPMQTPFFMEQHIMAECAQLSQFDEELYKVSGEGGDKYLIATSEQPLAAYHRHDWVDPKELPRRYSGFSTCFRKEVGSHGRDTLGIFRVHQFEKIEQFCVASPDDNQSWEVFDGMISAAEEFYQSLKIPYRVVNIVSGALNDAAAKKLDLEAWFPASTTYRELVSCSNCLDYQARRLEVRYGTSGKVKKGAGADKGAPQLKKYVHMLNATLCATERALCCILENYQTDDGVNVPEVLQPFMGGKSFIPFVKPPPPAPKAEKKAAKKADA